MPYLKIRAQKNVSFERRPTVEMSLEEIAKLVAESKKSLHECVTLPSMQAVRP